MRKTADLVGDQAPNADRRSNEARRDGEDDHEFLVRSALRQALAVSDTLGRPRKAVAAQIGVKPETLEQWLYASKITVVPTHRLVMLLCGDALPRQARLVLWRALGDAAGLLVVGKPEAGPNGTASPHQQLAVIASAMGRVAAQINLACDPGSEAGADMSESERATLRQLLREMEEHCESMRATVQ